MKQGAYFGNPNVQRQGARARALAEQRDVNTLPDPKTYAVVQGLLGNAPDELGFSVMRPDYQEIKQAAEPAFYAGSLLQVAQPMAPAANKIAKAVDRGLLAADPLVQKYGRQVEQALAPLVQAGYQRGGLTREMLDAMGSGTRSQIFIGPEAKTWRKTEAFKAAQMEKAKASPEEIWKTTGTFRGPDGFWRQEIDDSASKFVNAEGIAAKAQALRDERAALKETLRPDRSGQGDLFPKQLTEARKPLRAKAQELDQTLSSTYGPAQDPKWRGNFAPYAYEHGPLYEAYPELRKVVVRQGERSGSDGVYGSYNPGQLDVTSRGLLNDPRSTTTHEFQHAVQDIEGFSPGGNTDYARRLGQEAMARIGSHNDLMRIAAQHLDDPVMRRQYDEAMAAREALVPSALGATDPYQAYRNLLGETEARAVQSRLPLSALQRRERFPMLDYETPRNQMIIPQNESLFKNSLLD